MSTNQNKKSIFFDFSERFLEFCNFLLENKEFKSHGAISQFFGFSRATMSMIVNKRYNITLSNVQVLLQKYPKLSPYWLILGIGNMLREDSADPEPTLSDVQQAVELKYLDEKVSLLQSIINDKDTLLMRDQEYITSLKEENTKLKLALKPSESGKMGLA